MSKASMHVACSVGLALALSGCVSSTSNPPVAEGWDEPGWMATIRQENEEFQQAMLSCYSEYGLHADTAIAGSVGFFDNSDASGNIAPDVQELRDRAAVDCNARVPLPAHKLTNSLTPDAYHRMLDVRACLTAHGYEVAEPPSEQTWIDTSPQYDAWNPYEAAFGGPNGTKISASQLDALDAACPQSGPNYFVLVSFDDSHD